MTPTDTNDYTRDGKGKALCLFFFFKEENGFGFPVTCLWVPETLCLGFLSFTEERPLGGGMSVSL